jgi:hypothetical protein
MVSEAHTLGAQAVIDPLASFRSPERQKTAVLFADKLLEKFTCELRDLLKKKMALW